MQKDIVTKESRLKAGLKTVLAVETDAEMQKVEAMDYILEFLENTEVEKEVLSDICTIFGREDEYKEME